MTKDERMHICDMGFYNDVIRGYLVQAMKFADANFTKADIESAPRGLNEAFDTTSAAEAETIYMKF